MSRALRLLDHIGKRTLLERIRLEWTHQAKKRRLSRWQFFSRSMEYLEVKVDLGISIRLHFDSDLARQIYAGDFENKERHFVRNFLMPGDFFVDVGANIGLFALIAARRVGAQGAVFAFEPSRKTFSRLCENVTLNRFTNILCLPLALSDEPGELSLTASTDGFDAWNSLAHPTAGAAFVSEMVRCETWDTFAENNCLIGKVTMMKIDVEGWESRLLAGGSRTLSRPDAPILQVEFTDEAAVAAGSNCHKLYRTLEALGYRIFTYDRKHRQLLQDPVREVYPYVNLIAAKDPDAVNKRLKQASLLRRIHIGWDAESKASSGND